MPDGALLRPSIDFLIDFLPRARAPLEIDGNGCAHMDCVLSWTGVREYIVEDSQGRPVRLRALRRPEQVFAPGHLRTLERITLTNGHPMLEGRPVLLDVRGDGKIDPDGFIRIPHAAFSVGQGGDTLDRVTLPDGMPAPRSRTTITDQQTIDDIRAGRTHSRS